MCGVMIDSPLQQYIQLSQTLLLFGRSFKQLFLFISKKQLEKHVYIPNTKVNVGVHLGSI